MPDLDTEFALILVAYVVVSTLYERLRYRR